MDFEYSYNLTFRTHGPPEYLPYLMLGARVQGLQVWRGIPGVQPANLEFGFSKGVQVLVHTHIYIYILILFMYVYIYIDLHLRTDT